MFPFNGKAIQFGYHILKGVSKSTLDPRITFVRDGEEVKLPLPSSIGRRLNIKLHKVSKFSVAFPCCVATLDGRIVAVDVPSAAEFAHWGKTQEWVSPIEKNLRVVQNLDEREWLFDGQYAYRNDGPLQVVDDTSFAYQPVKAYDLFKMDVEHTLDEISRACLGYKKNATEYQLTCPVTRASGGFLQLRGDVDVFSATDQFVDNSVAQELMLMDRNVIVNLKFVNYAAKRVTDCFGFEAAEPLGMPILMMEHRTMSLCNIPQSVQQSSPAPFKFTEGVAWIIGLFGQIETIEQLIHVKSIMKMLLTKGNTQVEHNTHDEDDTDIELTLKQKVEKLRASFEGAALIKF